jgi:serine/threonine protein kinase
MARVFKAWDTVLERPVAVKILYEHLAEDNTFKQRFEREAKFVASFNHPNIVQIYDFNAFDRDGSQVFYMVMVLLPGKTLKAVLEEYCERGERLTHERVYQIMLSLTDALGYAHARGMVHRDIKPGNILFDERGQAILTDFGIARLAQGARLTSDSVTVGTPAYMSPEQAVGAEVDSRSDLYALGVMFYEMLTGKVPYADDGSLSVLFKHINDPIPQVSEHLSGDNAIFDTLVFKALAKDPNQRYQTAKEFHEDLKAAFSGRAVAPPRATVTSEFKAIATTPAQQDKPMMAGSRVSLALNTITRYIPPETKRYAPLGIFIVGMMLIGILVGAGLVNNQLQAQRSQPTEQQAESMTDDEVESMVESMTEAGPLEFTSGFAPDDPYNMLWSTGEMNGVLRELTRDGFYRFINPNAGTALTTILEGDHTYDYVIITMEARLDTGTPSSSGYGIVFRYQDNDNYNVFAVDGAGRYSIWVRSGGRWTELRSVEENWTPNDAIMTVGNINRLTLHVQGSLLTGEVNGTQVTNATDNTLGPGRIGIYLATPPDSSNSAVLMVDSYEVVPSVAAMTEPSIEGGAGR